MDDAEFFSLDDRWHVLRRLLHRWHREQLRSAIDDERRRAVDEIYQCRLKRLERLRQETLEREAAGEVVEWAGLASQLGVSERHLAPWDRIVGRPLLERPTPGAARSAPPRPDA